MNTESVALAVNARAVKAFNKRRDAARGSDAPVNWLLDYPRMASLVALAKRFVAIPTTPIVIQGERGCGVHTLARLIHQEDPIARSGRFRLVPAHFVSANEMRGWPNHGTLVIEDVEHLKAEGQAWVAQTLAERSGDPESLRIVATTRFSVGELLERRDLSQELIYALDVFRLVVPPLRDRSEEISRIARMFLEHYGEAIGLPSLRFSEGAERRLAAHSYPANMCELRNVVERAVALAGAGESEIPSSAIVFHSEASALPIRSKSERATAARGANTLGSYPTLAELERDYLTTLIRERKGRRTDIARIMGVSYQTVLNKITRHQLDVRAIVATSLERGPGE
jgi:two-component system, NtrC family, response regulator AtoC